MDLRVDINLLKDAHDLRQEEESGAERCSHLVTHRRGEVLSLLNLLEVLSALLLEEFGSYLFRSVPQENDDALPADVSLLLGSDR